jgi:hypothetical protein
MLIFDMGNKMCFIHEDIPEGTICVIPVVQIGTLIHLYQWDRRDVALGKCADLAFLLSFLPETSAHL